MNHKIGPQVSMRLLLALVAIALLVVPYAFTQETTAQLQGTVKDPSGAVVAKAKVEVTGTALIGSKTADTDTGGYYHFYNLPPGTYTMTVSAAGFSTARQEGIKLEVGRIPTIDIALKVGSADQVVEITGETPLVDVVSSKATTVVTQEVMVGIPKGRSFQSLISFAPGARQEPLMSNAAGRGNGFQIDGASDGDNAYLVEGMDTTEVRNGGTGTNVPLEFLQEVEVKSSGFEAEYGSGGSVVNVKQKQGTSAWHGQVFMKLVSSAFNANDQCGFILSTPSNQCGARGNPEVATQPALRIDRPLEYYLQKKDHYRILEPGFEVGGPLLKDRLWLFISYLPTFDRVTRTVNYIAPNTGGNLGPHAFSRNSDTHNALTRLDYKVTNSIRLWGSWQYGYNKTQGINLPVSADSVIPCFVLPCAAGTQRNTAAGTNPSTLRPDTGTVNPLNIFTFGGDWTPSSNVVVTARYGHFFYNTEDRGRPQGIRDLYDVTLTPTTRSFGPACLQATTCPFIDTTGASNGSGFANIPSNFQTFFEGIKRKQFQVDLAYHVGHFLGGTHNFKFGYGFNRLSDNVLRGNKTALVVFDWGQVYSPLSSEGVANCATLSATNLDGVCAGTAGYFVVRDGVDVAGNVSSYNHSIYLQDAWTYKRLTVNVGIRFDKENVPPFSAGANSIHFGFTQKVAPRLGAAYDLMGNGKVKIYASYGKFFDVMKYSLPRGSFGGEYWHDCVYALNDSDFASITPSDPVHACGVGGPAPGVVPSSSPTIGAFIENVDLRKNLLNPTFPGLDPNIKPMQQHEFVVGTDWAITPTLGFSARYVRKRLDWAIEDMALTDDLGFYIGNPGTVFGDLVRRVTPPDTGVIGDPGHPAECPTCPAMPKALRRYDGLEFRLTKSASARWFGTVSYTYSRLRGNYSGLTASTITDGGFGGRHNPNNDRSFDAPQMQWDSHGHIVDGPLGTDRPHTLKLFGFYRLKWFHQETLFGLSQVVFSGTPVNTCWNTNGGVDGCVFPDGRDAFMKLHTDPVTGDFINDGVVHGLRTPKYTQTDFSFVHEVKVSKNNERLRLGVEWNVSNLLNQRSVIQNWPGTIAGRFNGVFPPTACGGGATPDPFVADAFNSPTCVDFLAYETGWDPVAITNATPGLLLDTRYGKPVVFQAGRTMRFKLKFTF